MKLFDTHVHSALSFDSREPMENYVKKAVAEGAEYFITTEHADLESHVLQGDDIVADFDLQMETIRKLNEKYPVKVLMGIEVGWRRDIHHRNMEIVKKYPFDMVILSIHETEYTDVSMKDYKGGRTTDQCYDEYLHLVCDAIEAFDDFDTFAHLDYVLRYTGHTDLSRHSEMLTKIFNMLIEKDKALEINTKTLPEAESLERMEYLISLYAQTGGKKVTIGSDAHFAARHMNCFDMVRSALKRNGIDSVCVFVGRKVHNIAI